MEEHNTLGIFGEILYYGGTAEGWILYHKENPSDSLSDYLDALKFAHEAEKTKQSEAIK